MGKSCGTAVLIKNIWRVNYLLSLHASSTKSGRISYGNGISRRNWQFTLKRFSFLHSVKYTFSIINFHQLGSMEPPPRGASWTRVVYCMTTYSHLFARKFCRLVDLKDRYVCCNCTPLDERFHRIVWLKWYLAVNTTEDRNYDSWDRAPNAEHRRIECEKVKLLASVVYSVFYLASAVGTCSSLCVWTLGEYKEVLLYIVANKYEFRS